MLSIDRPIKCRTKNAIITESGMERKTAAVARTLPRKIKIITAVRKNSDAAFAHHRRNSFLHEYGLVENNVGFELRGNIAKVLNRLREFR